MQSTEEEAIPALRKHGKRQNVGPGYQTSILATSNIFLPARLHLVKVLYPSYTAPSAGAQIHEYIGTFYVQITMTVLFVTFPLITFLIRA